MKYIVDTDALKDCLKLLHSPTIICGEKCIRLKDVIEMIDKFPKNKLEDVDLNKEK